MRILQLCVFTNLWEPGNKVNSIDLKNGKDIFQLKEEEYINQYDLICAAPPCDQFTKANALNWEVYPDLYIKTAKKCLDICRKSLKYWFLENTPGRIERFIPELKQYRVITWRDYDTNKEYVIYSNFMIVQQQQLRYGKEVIKRNKTIREEWRKALITDIEKSLNN